MTLRLALTLVFLGLWSTGIGWRLYDLQVSHHRDYARRAERQQQSTVRLDSPRGTIYDSQGRVLAVSGEAESVYAVPSEVAHPEAAALALGRVLGMEPAALETALTRHGGFAWVARKLEPHQAQAVRDLGLSGIYFLREYKRYYPYGRLAASVLGFVGVDNDGLWGLESAYEEIVAGRSARRTVLRDAHGETVVSPELSFTDAEPGQNLYVTLDATIQHMAERGLAEMAEWSGARAGVAILLDSRDSAVLAMASYPGFDPNRFDHFPEDSWRNRSIVDAYEPGSTFKLITAAAALESSVATEDDLFDCEEGGVAVGGVYIRDHKPFGILTLEEVIARSSNVGAIKTGLRVGPRHFYSTIRAFGFGAPTGIDLPGESPGILRPFKRWTELATAYASFGQGISVTPIQLANAFATVANGGERMRPYIVAAHGPAGEAPTVTGGAQSLGRAVSAATAQRLVKILQKVVTNGTGTSAAIPGYAVAGKTGTAQKAERGGYSETGFMASFVGFAPAERPRITGLVLLDEPHRSIHGSEVGAPAFSSILGPVLLYLGVSPDRALSPDEVAWLPWVPPASPGAGRDGHSDPSRRPGAVEATRTDVASHPRLAELAGSSQSPGSM